MHERANQYSKFSNLKGGPFGSTNNAMSKVQAIHFLGPRQKSLLNRKPTLVLFSGEDSNFGYG